MTILRWRAIFAVLLVGTALSLTSCEGSPSNPEGFVFTGRVESIETASGGVYLLLATGDNQCSGQVAVGVGPSTAVYSRRGNRLEVSDLAVGMEVRAEINTIVEDRCPRTGGASRIDVTG